MCIIIIYSINIIFKSYRRRNDKKVKYTPSRKSTIALEDYTSGISMFVLLCLHVAVLGFFHPEPLIEEFPTDTTATEGEGVFFKVVVRGYPQPSLTWYHEDTQLTSDYSLELTQDGSLSIIATELKHSGVYKLLAKNSSGSVEREVRLTVRQEEEEAAPVARERVDVQPVSVAEFGDYVAYCHSNSDEMFKYQYMVR